MKHDNMKKKKKFGDIKSNEKSRRQLIKQKKRTKTKQINDKYYDDRSLGEVVRDVNLIYQQKILKKFGNDKCDYIG